VDGCAVKWLLMSLILLDHMGNFVRVALLVPTVLRDRAAAPALWRVQWHSALFGGRLLGEGDRTLRGLGALCIGSGVVALGLG
jgi:hypothetical protein